MARSTRGAVRFVAGIVGACVPTVVLVIVASLGVTGRDTHLAVEIAETKALLAAESGVDSSAFLANTGRLVPNTPFHVDLGRGMSFHAMALDLLRDGIDNDGDRVIDESDETMFEVEVTGSFRGYERTLSVYLSPASGLLGAPAALSLLDPRARLVDAIDGRVRGFDTNPDGTRGPGPDRPGIAIHDPGLFADARKMLALRRAGRRKISGIGARPSIALASKSVDFQTVFYEGRANADVTAERPSYVGVTWGSSRSPLLIFRDGDLRLEGDCSGSGMLMVTGKLEVLGKLKFEGIVVGMESIRLSRGVKVFGGVVLAGPGFVSLADGAVVNYSSRGAAAAQRVLPSKTGYVVSRWRDVSKTAPEERSR